MSCKNVEPRTVIFSSERLDFCLWNLSRPEEFVQLCQKPGLSDFGSPTYDRPSTANALQFVQQQIRDYQKDGRSKFAVVRREDQTLIGIAGIFEMDPPFQLESEINYRFIYAAQRQGYGIEAAAAVVEYGFKKLGLTDLHASVSPSNERSKAVLTKLGMTPTRYTQDEEVWAIRVAN